MAQYLHLHPSEEVFAVIDWPASKAHAASEAIFGSASRGDVDALSDRDILIIDNDVKLLQRRSIELAEAGWSVASYTFAKFDALCACGALFVQHIKLESKIITDRGRALSRRLAAFEPRVSYAREITDNSTLAGLAGVVPVGARGTLFAADILYVTVRNFGVLSLAERGIHVYSFSAVLSALESEGLVGSGSARALAALRFLKCLYRSGETGDALRARSAVVDALEALPVGHFPKQMRSVCPGEMMLTPEPAPSMPAYFQLRDLERRFVALQALDKTHVLDNDLRALSRWIENPRAYASISSRLAPDLRNLMRSWTIRSKLAAG
jgi:predicted nucleotidyltransferase